MFLKDIMMIYRDSDLPCVGTDKEFNVLDKNEAALSLYPSLKLTDGFNMMFSNEIKKKFLKITSPERLSVDFLNFVIMIIPFEEGFCFIIENKCTGEESIFGSSEALMLNPFSAHTRGVLSEIFSAVSSITRVGEIEENERLLTLTQSINLNSYKLLRASNFITSYCKALKPDRKEHVILDFGKLFSNICQSARVITNDLGIPLNIDIDDSEVIVKGDSEKISEAVISIIDNCCKFSKEGNEITVKLVKKEKSVTVTIKDKGMGIPKEVLGHVFEPFFSFNRDQIPFGGLGLGLTLARLTVIAHGGTMNLVSTDYEGTTVLFDIPLLKEEEKLELNCSPTVSDILRDRFSQLHIIMSDVNKAPMP